jgi:hypothetical protein
MPAPKRIRPEDAQRKHATGEALLVCAYEDDAKCEKLRLEGALTLGQLQKRLSGLSKDRELLFYCA